MNQDNSFNEKGFSIIVSPIQFENLNEIIFFKEVLSINQVSFSIFSKDGKVDHYTEEDYMNYDSIDSLDNFILKLAKEDDYSIYKLDLTYKSGNVFYSNDSLLVIEGGSGINGFELYCKFLNKIEKVIFKYNYWDLLC